MPTPYNGGQSPLEYYAINGNPMYPGSGRYANIGTTFIGTTKYTFKGPYKNPVLTGNANDKYSATHTNAINDTLSPYNGKGTNSPIDVVNTYNGVTARVNYNGGNIEDINGVASQPGSGRNPLVTTNAGLWGYGPTPIAGADYTHPNTSANIGQVII